MSECPYHLHVEAYHDREMPAEVVGRFESHLVDCPACAVELERLREFSAGIAAAGAQIAPEEMAAIHQAVNQAIDAQNDLPLLRTAGMLAALAASVLIICGIWWIDTRSAGVDVASGKPAALSPEWEQMATTLRADPSPGLAHDSFFSPHYAATLEFMLNSLLTTERKPWEKPKSF